MKIIYSHFLFLLFFLPGQSFIAQQSVIDSLENYLSKAKNDTNKINALIRLASFKPVVQQLKPCEEALNLARKLNYKAGKINAILRLSGYYEFNADFRTSLSLHEEASKVAESINDEKAMLSVYGGIYNAALNLGNYPKALEVALKGLKIAEKENNKLLIANYDNLVACVHISQNNFPKAKEYFSRYLKLAEETGNRHMLANAYLCMVPFAGDSKNSEQPLEYLRRALAIYNELSEEDTRRGKDNRYLGERIAYTYNGIASFYKERSDYINAIQYSKKCLSVCHDVMGGDRGSGINLYDLSVYYVNYGEILTGINNFEKAEPALIKGLNIALEIPHQEDIKLACAALTELYVKQKDFKKALEFQKKYSDIKDSLLNEKVTKQTAEMNTVYETEKKDKELIKKDAEIKNEQLLLKQQSTVRNAFIAGFILVTFLALFILRSYSLKRSANIAISLQKELIEIKNKEITDSIHYAKRIQKALLASDNLLDKQLADAGHEYFVLYKPKDIVSGDFYWARQSDNKFILCTADCTGHGVPGAFMSLLNISFLNETTIEKKITRPDLVLNAIRTSIISTLNTDGNEESKDGMDCILCTFDFENNKLDYAAANNKFYIIRENKLIITNTDKMPVGKSPRDGEAFTLNSVEIKKGDIIYTITDGYADQFGLSEEAWKQLKETKNTIAKPSGKKFKYKQLEEILLNNHTKTLAEQKEILNTAIETWRGILDQVDDILIIGIKI